MSNLLDWLHNLPSYNNQTRGVPEPEPVRRLELATRVRLIGKCPGCSRHEDQKWWKPCPFTDCAEHAVKFEIGRERQNLDGEVRLD